MDTTHGFLILWAIMLLLFLGIWVASGGGDDGSNF